MKNLILLFAFTSLFLIGCAENEPAPGDGRLKVYMTDSPALYDAVNVTITGIEINKTGSGWISMNSTVQTFDLLDLQNGLTVLFCDSVLAPGNYTQIRLLVQSANVVVAGVTHNLEIPSGDESGLKLNHAFTINDGTVYELLLDFDANRSIHVTGSGTYKMKPVIRVVPMAVSGKIRGRVMPTDAFAYVWTTNGSDTISTFATGEGYFRIIALPNTQYDVRIQSQSTSYRDTVITGVTVSSGTETDIGTIILNPN